MSTMGTTWLVEYERVADEYAVMCAEGHPDEARDQARHRLRRLGLDSLEIEEHLAELEA